MNEPLNQTHTCWRTPPMKKLLLAASVLISSSLVALPASAADPAACQTVRLGDVGWTDGTAVTALTANVLHGMGYKTQIPMVALSVVYLSLQIKKLDAFMSDWEPSGSSVIGPYLEKGAVERIATNLSGAHYTLGVPDYVAAQGVHDFKDLAGWAEKFHGTIYGIEPGNDGNRIVLGMIQHNEFGLGKFHLNESSEQGMLSQVARAVAAKEPIVFLAWEPHPMNMHFNITYLTGGEKAFGASAEVDTIVRKGYATECPNVGRLLKQLAFSVSGENEMMKAISEDHVPAAEATKQWLKAHPDVLDKWLDGVTTFDGAPALPAVRASLGL
jgi:glycine betaine/proline transport system substrate-binding protein